MKSECLEQNNVLNESSLINAIKMNDEHAKLNELLSDDECNPNEYQVLNSVTGKVSTPPLFFAIERNDADAVELLLAHKEIDPWQKRYRFYRSDNITAYDYPIHEAISRKRWNIVNHFLDYFERSESKALTNAEGYSRLHKYISILVRQSDADTETKRRGTVVLLKCYRKHLMSRVSEYGSNYAKALSIFGGGGFNKTEKLAAAKQLQFNLSEGAKLPACQNGRLGDICALMLEVSPLSNAEPVVANDVKQINMPYQKLS